MTVTDYEGQISQINMAPCFFALSVDIVKSPRMLTPFLQREVKDCIHPSPTRL